MSEERSGAVERHIARGGLLAQVAQVWGTICMLAVATVLGRSLELSAFGVYGLLLSLAGYLLIVQLSVEAAAIRALSGAVTPADRERIFSTALAIYAAGGVVAGAVLAGAGVLLVGVIGIPESLQDDARIAVVALGAVTALGWPFKVFQDALRAAQLFGAAAIGEMAAYATVAAGVVVLTLADAPLWAVTALVGGLSALVGLWCAVVLATRDIGLRFRRSAVSREEARSLFGVSIHLLSSGLADLVIYSLDRVILSAYKGATQVGLYEGAVRPHNLLRVLHGTLVLTVVPVASGFLASGDDARLRELLVRGTRYVLAIVAPVTVVLMVLGAPLLEAWLGEKFRVAGAALAILSSYWLIGANTGVAGSMLVAAGKVRELARYAWLVAGVNLVLALTLTPLLGLEGIALAIAAPYVLLFPVFLRLVLQTFPVSVRDLAREAWLPAYSVCALTGVALGALRLAGEPEGLLAVGAAALGGLALAWGAYWVAWLTPGERTLIRDLLRIRRRSGPGD